MLGMLTPQSRIGWQNHMVSGWRLVRDAVKWIQKVDGGRVFPVLSWRVEDFVNNVASKHDDMAGLRSEKSVYSFIMGHKIRGSVREVWGLKKEVCPNGWCRVAQPENVLEYLERAPLPWETV